MDPGVMSIGGTPLTDWFLPDPAVQPRVGVEIELAAVDPDTGLAVAYHGPHGVRRLLETVLAEGGGDPVLDEDVLLGVRRGDGTTISLEPSGAVEYASPPCPDLAGLIGAAETELALLAEHGRRLGIALVPGGSYPFNDISTVNWTPNRRIRIMSDYFSSVGKRGAAGARVMGLTLSTQATVDYLSPADLGRKLRMQVAVSPVAAALFVNSPLEAGRATGMQSHRMTYWFRHSPGRTGILPPGLLDSPSIDDFVEWAVGLRTIYRKRGNGYVPAPDRPFRELLRVGYDDGTKPTWSDWLLHLSQIWTDVRLRRTLELRAFDGPPGPYFAAVPAFWTGLSYHAPSCEAAWQLTRGRTAEEYLATMRDIARRGTRARFGPVPVAEVAAELLRLAREGLRARVRRGLEAPGVLSYLEPVEEVVHSGSTFADTCLRRWDGELRRRPDRYVEAYRV